MFFFAGPSCRHIKKGTDQTLFKKLSENSNWTSCQDCKNEENKEEINTCMQQGCEEEQETPSIWMCLKCGHGVSFVKHLIQQCVQFCLKCRFVFYQGCGRNSEHQHAIKHYETPHSDPHCLVISLDSWSVW